MSKAVQFLHTFPQTQKNQKQNKKKFKINTRLKNRVLLFVRTQTAGLTKRLVSQSTYNKTQGHLLTVAFQNSINTCPENTFLIFDVTHVKNKPGGYQLIIQDDTANEAAPKLWIVTHA